MSTSTRRGVFATLLTALLVLTFTTLASSCTYRADVAGGRPYYLTGDLTGSAKRALAVVLPGINSNPLDFESKSGFGAFAEKHGFAVAYGVEKPNGWNAGGCCGTAVTAHTNDMAYLLAVVATAEKRVPVDTSRIYVIGFSTGGMMAERAACERPDVFAAAGSVSGALLVPCPKGARVVHIHGAADTMVPLHGGPTFWTSFRFPNANAEKGAILNGHPDAAYTLIVLPNFNHGWPTKKNPGFDGNTELWSLVSQYHN